MRLKYLDKDRELKIEYLINPNIDTIKEWEKINKKWEKSQAKEWNWITINNRIKRLAGTIGQKPYMLGIKINGVLAGMSLSVHNIKLPRAYYIADYKNKKIKFRRKKPSYIMHLQNYIMIEKDKGSFLWYLHGAPRKYLEENGIFINGKDGNKKSVSIGKALVHAIIEKAKEVNSCALRLHADPKGEDKLLKIYNDFGFDMISGESPISALRINDGRYFEVTNKRFEEVQSKLLQDIFSDAVDIKKQIDNKPNIKRSI